jgi:cytochrome P450
MMRAQTVPTPPGPRGLPIIGSALAFRRDPFGFLERTARRHGDLVYSRFAGQHFYLVSNPAAIEQVLVGHRDRYRKDKFLRGLAVVMGKGLLLSEGSLWRQQRRLMAPAFAHRHVGGYARTICACTVEHAGAWPAGVLDVGAAMTRLTLDVALRTLFGGADPRPGAADGDAARVGEAVTVIGQFFADALGAPVPVPLWVPTPGNRALRRAIAELDLVVARILQTRRAAPPVPEDSRLDLLGMLLAARDEDGQAMDDVQLRDEVLTLLLAGHDTTSQTLTYALRLLAHHPDVQAALVAELAAHGPAAPLLEQIVLETMRLYPTVATLGREAIVPDEIAGYAIPVGATVVLSPWVVHRDPRHFPDPGRFLPTRWTPDFRRQLPRFAYFPFGGGARVCIGEAFALLEARLALAEIVGRWRLEVVDRAPLELLHAVTVRPKHPVRLLLRAREVSHG